MLILMLLAEITLITVERLYFIKYYILVYLCLHSSPFFCCQC
jgi:hypothetical protein